MQKYCINNKYMPATTSISANIPKNLGNMLHTVAAQEERPKSYYVQKGLEMFLYNRLEDWEDYQDAQQAYDEFVASGEKSVPLEEVFKDIA